MRLLNAFHSATHWRSSGTSGGDRRVKKGQSMLAKIPESMRTDRFHRRLIQWSGKCCKEVCPYNVPATEIHRRAIAALTQADGSGKI